MLRTTLPFLAVFACNGACNGGGGGEVGTATGPKGNGAACQADVAGAPSLLGVDWQDGSAPFEERRLRMRELRVTAPDGAEISVEGGVVVLDETGSPVGTLGAVDGEQVVYVEGTAAGEGSVRIAPVGDCTADDAASIEAIVRRPPDLAGRSVTGFPHFTFVDAFNVDQPVQIALDSRDFPDRAGQPFDAWVVPHRSASEWAADPSLSDAADGAVSHTLVEGGRTDNLVDLWLSDLTVPSDRLFAEYDIVLDFDGDGRLDPGEPVDGIERPGFTAIRDLTDAGPYTPSSGEHSVSYWNTMVVYWPDASATGPRPLVVISHGNGHDYTWYDYLGNHFASWGYVVIAHRNDTSPGVQAAAVTTITNTDTFLNDWNTLGLPVDVDGDRIAWIGHSRGGEGIVIAYDAVKNGNLGLTTFDHTDIRLLQSIAPTNFQGPDGANPSDVPFHILAGSADGDVTGGPDSGITQYFRMFQRGTADHWVTYVQGADHNDFNCCGDDDSQWFTVQGNPPVIGRSEAQDVARSYLLALLESELLGNHVLRDYLARSPETFAPIGSQAIVATQYMPGADADKWVLDDFQTSPGPDVSSSGGAVTSDAAIFGEGALDDGNTQLTWNDQDQTNGMTWSHNDTDPERGAMVEWGPGEDVAVEWDVGSGDWSGWTHLSFRAAQSTRNGQTVGLNDLLSFTVELEDGSGATAAIDFAHYGRATEPYPRAGLGSGVGWVNEFQTVRIPLADFDAGPTRVDRGDITALRFRFGSAHGSPQGRAAFDDLELYTP